MNGVMVRIVIGIEERLDSDLVARAAVNRGDAGQATIDEIMNAALTQFLQEAPILQGCGSPGAEDWELETPTGRFRIRSGRVEALPSRLPMGRIAETLAAMYHLEDANDSGNHYSRR